MRTTNSADVWRQRALDLLNGGQAPNECGDGLARERAHALMLGLPPTL